MQKPKFKIGDIITINFNATGNHCSWNEAFQDDAQKGLKIIKIEKYMLWMNGRKRPRYFYVTNSKFKSEWKFDAHMAGIKLYGNGITKAIQRMKNK